MPNGGGRSSKTFDMTKDGFTLLAMVGGANAAPQVYGHTR